MNAVNDERLLFWLRFYLKPQIGPKTFWKRIESGRIKEEDLVCINDARVFLEKHQEQGVHIVPEFSAFYPSLLGQCEDRPPFLYILSKTPLENLFASSAVAIVGSRRASYHAQVWTKKLASFLGEHRFSIVSGLAKGIDGAAHQGALLSLAFPKTIAVLAGGVNKLYPKEHQKLYEQIQEEGAIISEEPLDVEPRSHLFPKRNRIIAGISTASIIVEAARRSGSLLTAKAATHYGRIVIAVPGSPWEERCLGSNHLIKMGAHIGDNFEEIYQTLCSYAQSMEGSVRKNDSSLKVGTRSKETMSSFESQSFNSSSNQPLEILEENILSLLSSCPISCFELSEQLKTPLIHLLPLLSELDCRGKIKMLPGHIIVRL